MALGKEEYAGQVKTLAFVVMPDHFHWLFQQSGDRPMSVAVNNVKSYSAKTVNRYLQRTGAVWQRGFYDRAIRREDDLVAVARYIVANPLRAGIVSSLGDYPHWDSIWL
jgi:REP element-mobilizing transposase RayT